MVHILYIGVFDSLSALCGQAERRTVTMVSSTNWIYQHTLTCIHLLYKCATFHHWHAIWELTWNWQYANKWISINVNELWLFHYLLCNNKNNVYHLNLCGTVFSCAGHLAKPTLSGKLNSAARFINFNQFSAWSQEGHGMMLPWCLR